MKIKMKFNSSSIKKVFTGTWLCSLITCCLLLYYNGRVDRDLIACQDYDTYYLVLYRKKHADPWARTFFYASSCISFLRGSPLLHQVQTLSLTDVHPGAVLSKVTCYI